MALVPLDQVWVTANFKETQLERHARRPARRRSRSMRYGGREFNGKVDSIAAATGARFSLLPPENATGNFVKVVQRVPVKIVLDAGQDPEHLLRPGHVGDADGVHPTDQPQSSRAHVASPMSTPTSTRGSSRSR